MNDMPEPQKIAPETYLYQEMHADQASVEKVEHASVSINVDANCAVATLLNKPCASSIHEAAIAIQQPDVNIHVDLEPIAVGLIGFGACIAVAAAVIARKIF